MISQSEMRALVESGVQWFEGGVLMAVVLISALVVTITLNIYWIWY
jgi:hypothetical protein